MAISRCRAKNPKTCRYHGGHVENGTPAPKPWKGMDSRPKRARAGKTDYKTRQLHGFRNEFRVCDEHDLEKVENYTFQWDAFTKDGRLVPVSIKTKKTGGSIELGDFFRQAGHTKDFYLHVSFWSGGKEDVVEEHILYIPGAYWSSLFTHEHDADIKKMLANSSPDRSYDKKWKEDVVAIQKKWADSGKSVIRLCPKRDHKGQIRMQCAIPNSEFKKMIEKFSVKDFTSTASNNIAK